MLVAPYSPSARAKASTVPARMPWRQYGIRTRQKIHAPDCPSVWADQASVSSKLSNAPRAEASKKRAEEILAQKNLDKRDYELAQARLKRALVRTSVH